MFDRHDASGSEELLRIVIDKLTIYETTTQHMQKNSQHNRREKVIQIIAIVQTIYIPQSVLNFVFYNLINFAFHFPLFSTFNFGNFVYG